MIAAINGFLKIVPPVAWLAIVAVLFSMFLFNSWRLDAAQKALGAAEVAVDRAEEINAANAVTMAEFQTANEQCIAGRQADEQKFSEARGDWRVEVERLAAQAQEVRVEEIEVYRDPTCADLAQLDVGASCPDLAARLRVRTESLDRIRNSGSQGAGEGANPG